jgi:hypothetical protein
MTNTTTDIEKAPEDGDDTSLRGHVRALVKGIKERDKRLADQEQRISDLRVDVDVLKRRLPPLRAGPS